MTANIEQRWNTDGEESWCIISGDLIIGFGPGALGKESAESVIARGDDPSGYNNCPDYTLAAWQNAAESLPAHQEQKVCPGCGDSEAGCHQAGCWKTGVMYAAEPKPTPSEQDDKGSWPLGCVQRAFVEGMKWWQFQHNGSTAFASEVDEAEAEAVNRYGKPQPDSSSISTEQACAFLMRAERAETELASLRASVGEKPEDAYVRGFDAGYERARAQSKGCASLATRCYVAPPTLPGEEK